MKVLVTASGSRTSAGCPARRWTSIRNRAVFRRPILVQSAATWCSITIYLDGEMKAFAVWDIPGTLRRKFEQLSTTAREH